MLILLYCKTANASDYLYNGELERKSVGNRSLLFLNIFSKFILVTYLSLSKWLSSVLPLRFLALIFLHK